MEEWRTGGMMGWVNRGGKEWRKGRVEGCGGGVEGCGGGVEGCGGGVELGCVGISGHMYYSSRGVYRPAHLTLSTCCEHTLNY